MAATTTAITSVAATTSTSSLAAATSSTAASTTSAVAATTATTSSTSQAVVAAAVSSTSSTAAPSSRISSSSAVASSIAASSSASSPSAHSTSTTATINSSSVLAFISQSADGSTGSGSGGNGLKGGVIGGIVGGVVGGIILLIVVFKLLKRRRGKLNAERNPPPPPRDMAYIGSAGMAHRRNQSMNMNRASSYNNLMSPPLSHYGSQGMLKGSSDTPSEVGALDSAPIGGSPGFFPRDAERGYAPAINEPYSPAFPQEDHSLNVRGLMAPIPRSMADATTDDAVSAPSSTPSPVPFDNMDGLAAGMRPVASGDGSSGGDRTTASASRSASDSSTTSSPRLLAEGSQAHRSRSHNQLPRVPTHLRNLTASTSGSYGGYGAFSPGSRPTSHNSLSSMTGGRPRQLSGTPHNGRPIVLSMPQPLSETTEMDGYLPPSPSMYGQHGQGFNEFGAMVPPSSSDGSSAGRGRRSDSPSLLSSPPSTDRRR